MPYDGGVLVEALEHSLKRRFYRHVAEFQINGRIVRQVISKRT